MSMSKSRRLEPVVRVTEHREQEAIRALGQARQALEAEENKLTELREYRRDYQQRLQQRGTQGMDIGVLQEYRRFVAQLDVAIGQQEGHLARAREVCAACETQWQERRIRSQAMDKAVARCRETEQRTQTRREQYENDDRAACTGSTASDIPPGDKPR